MKTAALALALAAFLAPDTSGRAKPLGKDWLEHGRVIKRLDKQGRLFLYTYDDAGRLVGMDGIAVRFDAARPESVECSPAAWSHRWTFDAEGRLTSEIECSGRRHDFDWTDERKIDADAGTALKAHRHIAEAGHLGRQAKAAELGKDEK